MRPDDPRHGTHAGYVAHSKTGGACPPCEACLAARRAYTRRMAYDRLAGRVRTVDAARARQHIIYCVGWGMRLAPFVAAGVPSAKVIHSGQVKRIRAVTEARVLAVWPEPGVNCWPAFSAIRRLQSLVALGHPQEDLTVRLGVARSYVSMLIRNTRGWKHLDPDMWRRIAALYDELSMRPGTSVRAKNRALARGWVPPLAWDDIDDPNEQPAGVRTIRRPRIDVDEAVVLRILNGEAMACTKAEKEEVTRRWIALGRPVNDLAEFTGWKPERYGHVNDQAVAS